MFFIVRALFWIGVVLFLLPATSAPKIALANSGLSIPGASLGLSGSPAAASSAVEDAAAYCLRRPASCRDGLATARRFGEQLDHGAKAVATLILAASDRSIDTGSIIPIPPPRPAARFDIAR